MTERAHATHAFVPNPWGHDRCDGKIDDGGRVRTCSATLADPVHAVAEPVLSEPLRRARKHIKDSSAPAEEAGPPRPADEAGAEDVLSPETEALRG